MPYHILNQNKLVKIVKTVPELSKYMKKYHPTKRGFSEKTIRKLNQKDKQIFLSLFGGI